jgi:hypothetical protein
MLGSTHARVDMQLDVVTSRLRGVVCLLDRGSLWGVWVALQPTSASPTIYKSAPTWLTLLPAPRLYTVELALQLTAFLYLPRLPTLRTWASSCTSRAARPDIAYAVGVLGRHKAAPTEELWTAAKGMLRYCAVV